MLNFIIANVTLCNDKTCRIFNNWIIKISGQLRCPEIMQKLIIKKLYLNGILEEGDQ